MTGISGRAASIPTTNTEEVKGREFQWWLLVMLLIIGWMAIQVLTTDRYGEAWENIVPGLRTTLYLTVVSFAIAVPLGLAIGMARLSRNRIVNTIAQVYIEFVRGMPMLVWLFVVAFVLTRDLADLINVRTRDIDMLYRGAAALSLFYAAFIAEVFRAGIQSVGAGQVEAARAVGLGRLQVQRHVVLPQALRNALPALGNDFIALMKDTSLVSVLAIGDITYEARIYLGSSFRIRESYFILAIMYVTMTLILSLGLQWWERRLDIPGPSAD
ncbi:MAG: amino acid ABC transporter permease [Acidimicrobiales bacterium]